MQSVTVLISTYNGSKYLKSQIESVLSQESVKVKIIIRDDGSTDDTVAILNSFINYSNVVIIQGHNIGYAKSFMELVNLADDDYFAFCDQDDIWLPNKLYHSISKIESADIPSLYLSQATLVDEQLNALKSKFHSRVNTPGSVLSHSFAIGCTMVFNKALRDILIKGFGDMELSMGHDTWVFNVAHAVNSNIYFDLDSYILYRQHKNNVSGKSSTFRKKVHSIFKILSKWKNSRSLTAIKLLVNYNDLIPNENLMLYTKIASYKNNVRDKFKLLFDKKIYTRRVIIDILIAYSIITNRY